MVVVLAAMLVAFYCFLRKDNFTVEKQNAYNYRRHLTRGEVRFGATSLHFTFHHSKTNHYGLREHVTKDLAMPGRLLDPFEEVVKAFALCPRASATDTAFAVPSDWCGPASWTHALFVETLRKCLYEIGVDPSLYFFPTGRGHVCTSLGDRSAPHQVDGRLAF
jgi:hypothetical protein